MTLRTICGFTLIFFFSACSNQKQMTPVKDHASAWIAENEEKLYAQLLTDISKRFPDPTKNFGGGFSNTDTTTYWGKVTQKLNGGHDSIDIQFSYLPHISAKAKIYLSTNYNKRLVPVLDSLLVDTKNLKSFDVIKYRQPTNALYIEFNTNGESVKIYKEKIGAEILNNSSPYHIRFSIAESDTLDDISYERLFKHFIGEELYLKKVGSISHRKVTSLNSSLLSIKELIEKLSE